MSEIQRPSNVAGLYTKGETLKQLQSAVAIVYGFGPSYGILTLVMFILEHGIPSREEREALVAARLAEEDDITE